MPRGNAATQSPALTGTEDGRLVDAAPKMFTLEQVALSCGVHVGTVKRWIAQGRLRVRCRAKHFIRRAQVIDSRDFDDYLRREWPYFGSPEFYAHPTLPKIWARLQRLSAAGNAARRAKKAAREAAERGTPQAGAEPSGPISSPGGIETIPSSSVQSGIETIPSVKPIPPIDETYSPSSSAPLPQSEDPKS